MDTLLSYVIVKKSIFACMPNVMHSDNNAVKKDYKVLENILLYCKYSI